MRQDTRRIATRAEIDAYLVGVDEYWDFAGFPLWENPRFTDAPSLALHDLLGAAPPAQITLFVLSTVENQVNNGGLEQLFFNRVDEIHLIRAAIAEFGWQELTTRFEGEFAKAFGEAAKGKLAALNANFQADFRGGSSKEQTWSHFQKVYKEVDCDAFNSWFYAAQKEFHERIADFVHAHLCELFEMQS